MLEPKTSLVEVRPLRADEIEPLARAVPDELSEAQLQNRWREQDQGYRELLVARLHGEPVGTVSIANSERPPRSLHLFALEVATTLRGRGIGTALVTWVVDEARRRGKRRVFLEVRVDNPARHLYHRLGFRRVGGTFMNYWWRFNSDGTQQRVEEESLRMVKRLPPSRRRGARG